MRVCEYMTLDGICIFFSNKSRTAFDTLSNLNGG